MVKQKKRGDSTWTVWSAILLVLLLVAIVVTVAAVPYGIREGIAQAEKSYIDAYEAKQNAVYDWVYDQVYNANKVRNRATITITSVHECAKLEVLKVSGVAYIITNSDGKAKDKATAWLKVNGTGIFTVNLSEGEFIIDNERGRVLVRIPVPKLNAEDIVLDGFESLYFAENKWNTSIKAGEELATEQLNEAYSTIQEDFMSDENYTKLAKNSAMTMVAALIKGINPDIQDLVVDVEFYG